MDKPTYHAYLHPAYGPGDTSGVELRAHVRLVDFHHQILLDAVDDGDIRRINLTINSFLADLKSGRIGYTRFLGWWSGKDEFYNDSEGAYCGGPVTFTQLADNPAYILVIYDSQLEARDALLAEGIPNGNK